MSIPRFVKAILAALLIVLPGLAQQSNGRSYATPTVVVGNNMQWGHDGNGVNGIMLLTPIVTGPNQAASWGLFHANETTADAAGTHHHGMALYDATAALL